MGRCLGALTSKSIKKAEEADAAGWREREEAFVCEFMTTVHRLRQEFPRSRCVCHTTFRHQYRPSPPPKKRLPREDSIVDEEDSGFLVDFVFVRFGADGKFYARCVMSGSEIRRDSIDALIAAIREEMSHSAEGEVFIGRMLSDGLRAAGCDPAGIQVHGLAFTVKTPYRVNWSCKVLHGERPFATCRAHEGRLFVRKESHTCHSGLPIPSSACDTEGEFYAELADMLRLALGVSHDLATTEGRANTIVELRTEFPQASHIRHRVVQGMHGIAVDFLCVCQDGEGRWLEVDLLEELGFTAPSHPPTARHADLAQLLRKLRSHRTMRDAAKGPSVLAGVLNQQIEGVFPGMVQISVSKLHFPSEARWWCNVGCELFRKLRCEYDGRAGLFMLEGQAPVNAVQLGYTLANAVNETVLEYLQTTFPAAVCTRFFRPASLPNHGSRRLGLVFGYQIDFYFICFSGEDKYSAYFIFSECGKPHRSRS
jgi:hypothetical protein